MFDHRFSGIGLSEDFLPSGESHDDIVGDDAAEDAIAYAVTCLAMADGWVQPDRHLLPDIDSIPVGPFLAAIVASVDRTRLNGHDAVRLMQAEDRLASAHEAGKLATMAEVAFSPPGNADSPVMRSTQEIEYAACEIAAALTLTRRAAENDLNDAMTMTGRLRRAWELFASGDIGPGKMQEYIRQLGHLDSDVIDEVLDRTLEHARGLTRGQLRAHISRLVMEADPDGAASSMAEGLRERRVTTHSNPDFTGMLGIHSAHPMDVYRASRHIDDLARRIKTNGDERNLDQIRADVALDLLQGKCECGRGGRGKGGGIHLNVDVATLAGLTNTPGELAGYGPIIAEMARQIALDEIDGQWTYTITDDGSVIATGTLSRRPTAAQRRQAYADYPTCVFPGCRFAAYDCDLDHRRPHAAGGPTHNDNLEPLCRHHHMTRHHTPWQLSRDSDGHHTWTSPLGHHYLVKRGPPL